MTFLVMKEWLIPTSEDYAKKIEPDSANPTFVKTVVGVGYKFEDET